VKPSVIPPRVDTRLADDYILTMTYTPRQLRQLSVMLRQARAALQWSGQDLAEKAGVHFNTVWRTENGKTAPGPATERIVETLEEAGVEFLDGAVRLKETR
jgi:predicted transcriptional regulator